MFNILQKFRRRTPLGWLQLTHEKSRLLVAVSGIAFADVLMFMQLGFQTALYDSNTRLHRSLATDIILISPQARSLQSMSTFSRRRLYQAMDIPGVKSAEAMYCNHIIWKNPQTRLETGVLIIGINPNRPAFNLPEINEQLDKIKLPNTVLFDRAARGKYQQAIEEIQAGKTITTEINGSTITIGGLFKIGASFAADGSLITSADNFSQIFARQPTSSVSIGLVKIKPGYQINQVVADLKAYLKDDVRVLTHSEFIEFENQFWSSNSPIGFIFNLGVSMGFVVGVIIVYQILSTDVNAHLREYATFKAIGYPHFYLLTIIFEEALILAALGFLPGVAVSLGLYQLTRTATNLPMYMTIIRGLQVLLLTIIMCAISGAIATNKLQSADPADMF
ncbi:ABC transporter [Cuspidothrix issatschenkoi LEGE 03284]|uniref:ABC transporter permease DevC n=1 Tax=Cuspidothrix issatschenkoi TaxID=230752 RepID=UPI001882607D|nr:ABC transporter permease DevC [Cuspidothrix issatschenkoi]MBE9233582.1 ABC transporter [Cuspidothrix issatschenkoi LEGE 03284]